MITDWDVRNVRQWRAYIEENVFKVAFQDADWKQIPKLAEVGVFFRFNKTFHIDYLHFVINSRGPSRADLVRLEKNLLEYARLIKEIDLSPYFYTVDPENFQYGITRITLIMKNSPLWAEP